MVGSLNTRNSNGYLYPDALPARLCPSVLMYSWTTVSADHSSLASASAARARPSSTSCCVVKRFQPGARRVLCARTGVMNKPNVQARRMYAVLLENIQHLLCVQRSVVHAPHHFVEVSLFHESRPAAFDRMTPLSRFWSDPPVVQLPPVDLVVDRSWHSICSTGEMASPSVNLSEEASAHAAG